MATPAAGTGVEIDAQTTDKVDGTTVDTETTVAATDASTIGKAAGTTVDSGTTVEATDASTTGKVAETSEHTTIGPAQSATIPTLPAARSATGVKSPDPCLLYTSPSPRDGLLSRMPSSA